MCNLTQDRKMSAMASTHVHTAKLSYIYAYAAAPTAKPKPKPDPSLLRHIANRSNLSMQRSNGRIVEEAESHRLVWFCVVSRGSDATECVDGTARHHLFCFVHVFGGREGGTKNSGTCTANGEWGKSKTRAYFCRDEDGGERQISTPAVHFFMRWGQYCCS